MTGTREKQFRGVRMMHRIMLAAVLLYALLAERLVKSARGLPLTMTLSFGMMAIVIALIALGYRKKMLSSAVEALRRNPQDVQALFRWRQAHILVMVLLLSMALLGFALRFVGASFRAVLPFYFFSFALLLIWSPREVVAANNGAASDSFGNEE
jgi:hypothetical protein